MATVEERSDRELSGREKRTLALLGVPTFGMALAITVVTTYLPKVAREFLGSTAIIGVIVGGEGLLALFLPLLVGSWSDQLRTKIGGRLPFVLAGAPVMAVALVVMSLVSSIAPLALVVFVFFAAYFVAYEPYRALYPDLVEHEIEGKAQSTQALWRGAGTGLALVCGGLLLALAKPAPFVAAALVLLVAVGVFTWVMVKQRGVPEQERGEASSPREKGSELWQLVSDHPALRAYLAANALWELALGAIKTFVVLYITAGLGKSLPATAGVLGGVAVFILLASLVSGKLGDRLGRARVMRAALWVYGVGLIVPLFVTSTWVLAAIIPLVAAGGGTLMTLPYALLVPMMPEEHHGALTGFYSLSRGLGTMLGPLLAGIAIDLLEQPLSSTHGYAAMWGVASLAILASIPLLRNLGNHPEDRKRLQQA